jgi:hypothetical protein
MSAQKGKQPWLQVDDRLRRTLKAVDLTMSSSAFLLIIISCVALQLSWAEAPVLEEKIRLEYVAGTARIAILLRPARLKRLTWKGAPRSTRKTPPTGRL